MMRRRDFIAGLGVAAYGAGAAGGDAGDRVAARWRTTNGGVFGSV
jgi:hypothetical protein